ncbi:unnamed protein product [Cuscuta campestris]|uniref:Copper transport protein n=2 Tax=Cuscuta sect. Cleistogrammica TaxID=1824901 RepID=A0A484M1L8_9ASTE|nr:hypothetical protein DM860_000639 [Cuscuta australis]VFQ82334.1 unnamed protein product [Cuscuta campestris]
MMHMTFYWGKNVTVLFDFWKTDSWTSYALTLFVSFLFSVFYQYMEDRRLRFRIAGSSSSSGSDKENRAEAPLIRSAGFRRIAAARMTGALLFGISSGVGYLLMLAIMSFNAGVFIAVVVGLAVGHLLFRSGGDEDSVVVGNSCACA